MLASFVGLLIRGNTALADLDAERRALARLIHEIEAHEPLITTAASQAGPDARIRFRYDWLRQDLERIRAGTKEHTDAPPAAANVSAAARRLPAVTPPMTPKHSAAFQTRSSVPQGTLLTTIASVVLVLVFVWVLWVTVGTFCARQDA